jgi:hypothetical protein
MLSQTLDAAVLVHPLNHGVALLLLRRKVRFRRKRVLWKHDCKARLLADIANNAVVRIDPGFRQLGCTTHSDMSLRSSDPGTSVKIKHDGEHGSFGRICWLEYECLDAVFERDGEACALHAGVELVRL